MNANPASTASVAPALQSAVSRAHERPRATSLETFDVYLVSLDACRSSAPIAASLDANLRDQLRRASSSVVLNTAEGFGSVSRGVKRRHYEIARGSAMECVAILDLAVALGLEVVPAPARPLKPALWSSRVATRATPTLGEP